MGIRNELLEDILTATTGGSVPANNLSGGIFDYNDAATAITPITVTGGGGFVDLTNDELGAFTNKLFPPPAISDVWDATGNVFDFTELTLGDMVDIRLDVTITTASVNTEIEIDLNLGEGGSPYDIAWLNPVVFKDSEAHHVVVYSGIYMGDTNTLDNPAKFRIMADKTCTVVVNGWYCKVICRAP